jgi:tRNA (guanine37-N1)-methyltransferase
MKINLITCCPDYFPSILATSIIGRALRDNKISFEILSLRDFADGNRKKQVDDEPYGGGAGQILKIEPIARALNFLATKKELGRSYLTSTRGEIFTQKFARNFAQEKYLTLVCGHYEGVDERVGQLVDGQISLGHFVLTGGEPVAAVIIDATIRLLPGVLGNRDSLAEESFNDNCTIEYPQYTRPASFNDLKVPEVLLSGHHQEIQNYRLQNCKHLSPKKTLK